MEKRPSRSLGGCRLSVVGFASAAGAVVARLSAAGSALAGDATSLILGGRYEMVLLTALKYGAIFSTQ